MAKFSVHFQNKDEAIEALAKILKDPKLASLTKDELSVILWEDVVLPELEKLTDYYDRLNYAFGIPH